MKRLERLLPEDTYARLDLLGIASIIWCAGWAGYQAYLAYTYQGWFKAFPIACIFMFAGLIWWNVRLWKGRNRMRRERERRAREALRRAHLDYETIRRYTDPQDDRGPQDAA